MQYAEGSTATGDMPGAQRWLDAFSRAFAYMGSIGYANGTLRCVECPWPTVCPDCTSNPDLLCGLTNRFVPNPPSSTAAPQTASSVSPMQQGTTVSIGTTMNPSAAATTVPITPLTSTTPTTAAPMNKTTAHQVRLSGDWVVAISRNKTLVAAAAQLFVANAANVDQSMVVISSVTAGSLVVDYQITSSLDAASIDSLVLAGSTAVLGIAYSSITGNATASLQVLSATAQLSVSPLQAGGGCTTTCIALVVAGVVCFGLGIAACCIWKRGSSNRGRSGEKPEDDLHAGLARYHMNQQESEGAEMNEASSRQQLALQSDSLGAHATSQRHPAHELI